MPSTNPFELGAVLDATRLIGRAEELAQLRRSIHTRRPILLMGPRRHGKSAILELAAQEALDAGTVILHLDVEAFESVEALAQSLLTRAVRSLAPSLATAADQIGQLDSDFDLRVAADADDGLPAVTIRPKGGVGARGDSMPVLLTALDAVETLASLTGARVLVILDEVHHLLDVAGEGADVSLGLLVRRHDRLTYMFASSASPRRLTQLLVTSGVGHPPLGAPLFLGPPTRAEYITALRSGFTNSAFALEPGALDVLLDLTQRVPHAVLRLAQSCWSWLREDPSRVLGMSAVIERRALLLRQDAPAYAQLWTGLHRAQRIALKATLVEAGRSLLRDEVLSRYGIGASTMKQALRALDQRGLIREEQRDADFRFRIEDPFFGAWLRMAQRS